MVELELQTLQSISYIAGATGVCIAAFYYVLTLKNTQKNMQLTLESRQADILQRHAQINASQEFMDSWHDVVFKQNFLTVEEWRSKYGPEVNADAYTKFTALLQYYEILGGLLRKGLVNIEIVDSIWQPLHLIAVWEKFEPIVKDWRRSYQDDSIYSNIEYLFEKCTEQHVESAKTRTVWHEQNVRRYNRLNASS
jgi:hypothetical protein